ncbi:hypothetical protein DFH08DRAFT_821073 [Mycena albidolilacea]|uniref:F-box domain-containing protein n=1 Tax=Mycena albidolilacea TaxID=1033008 RepID=A0AAD6ZAP5_9AGAR|nr:hypothetical protein DFH08DRAFT_821073 [Mycena albidolilacea]
MRACLDIPEIVIMVVSTLDAQFGAKELAALARTSTIFHESALDVLWRYPDTIINLIRCIPADLWETSTFAREIVSSDWDRFLKYAPRIRSLSWVYQDDPALITVYEFLAQAHPPTIYSQIWSTFRSKTTTIQPTCRLHLFSSFLGHGLFSVVIQGVNADSDYSERIQLWDFVRALPRVEVLDVRIVHSETLEYLGCPPSLRNLRTIIPALIPLPGVVERSMFSALRELSFRPEQQDSGGGEIGPLILEFMETEPPILSPHPGSFFRPLFVLSRLTVVEIQVPAGYDLEDAIVADLARAWPNLEQLGLCSRSNYQSHASSMPPNPSPICPGDPLPQNKLKCLNVSFSRAADACVAATAAFMSSVFSSLTEIMTDEGYLWEDGDTLGRTLHHHRWKKIEQSVLGPIGKRRGRGYRGARRQDIPVRRRDIGTYKTMHRFLLSHGSTLREQSLKSFEDSEGRAWSL